MSRESEIEGLELEVWRGVRTVVFCSGLGTVPDKGHVGSDLEMQEGIC